MYIYHNVKIKMGFHNTALYDFNEKRVYLVSQKTGEALSSGKIDSLDEKTINKMLLLHLLTEDDSQKETTPLEFEYELFDDKYTYKKCQLAYLEITNKCNYHCLHCYANIQRTANQFMEPERVRKYIHQIAEIGNCDIRITGGEPFLNKNITEIIDIVHSDILPITRHSIVTNGSFDICKAIHALEAGFEMQISVYGVNKEKFISFTNTSPQVYERVKENLEQLSTTKYREQILLLFSVNSMSYDDIDVFKKYAEEKGFRYIFNRPASVGRAVDNWELLKLNEEDYESFSRSQRNPTPWFCYHICQLHWTSIMTNGDVSPCGFLRDKESILGNLEDCSFKELWESEIYQCFRKLNALSVAKCRDCEFCYLCTAGCCGETKAFHGNMTSPYVWCKIKPYVNEQYLNIEQSELYRVIKNAAGLFDFEKVGVV